MDLAEYLHATAFSPVLSTFQTAIARGNFLTWPGINNLTFTKLVGNTNAISKGHLDSERKIYNLQNHQSFKMTVFLPKQTK